MSVSIAQWSVNKTKRQIKRANQYNTLRGKKTDKNFMGFGRCLNLGPSAQHRRDGSTLTIGANSNNFIQESKFGLIKYQLSEIIKKCFQLSLFSVWYAK